MKTGEGLSPPQLTRGLEERRELPQRGPRQSPGRQRIFGIFEAHVENTSDRENSVTLTSFSVKNPLNRHGLPGPHLATPLVAMGIHKSE